MPSHDSLYLLKNALAIPKLMYILRASPCFMGVKLLQYDQDLKSALSLLINVDLGDSRWDQPVWAGGLGIRSAVMLAPSAFLASAAGTAALVSQILPDSFTVLPDPLVSLALNQ